MYWPLFLCWSSQSLKQFPAFVGESCTVTVTALVPMAMEALWWKTCHLCITFFLRSYYCENTICQHVCCGWRNSCQALCLAPSKALMSEPELATGLWLWPNAEVCLFIDSFIYLTSRTILNFDHSPGSTYLKNQTLFSLIATNDSNGKERPVYYYSH